MELSKLQTIALVVLTTILTDKFLIDHNQPLPPSTNITPPPSELITPTPLNANSQTEIILRELINLRKDMASSLNNPNTSANSNGSPTPTLSSSLLGGMVKINSPQWQKIDVYEKPLASSKIINNIFYDTIYFYRLKQDGWYQLDLDGNQLGWVQSQFLKEFP
ncbi:hypothetical protein A2574_02535 [Candidatus Shapirobacteria bacterium RIFOXYD1_FULL_38_32]|uniref:SH3b domain-containing protein n=4 Tax=Candidatus Shapironibacteriota TaxID=1752721 RepID=A0A0G0JNP4_9BACT|nr:MAG: hypothetical protein US90_C0024G0008 [Candidatus Shapirobacteria bacterium GW2011_GWE2_38_30]OGL56089.1 MAG: hypothetical protein A2195_02685 [Candidatus Shapirobacteria bacterium RIFOXYA1_FULL_39_17]OGL56586.1 MAG: hypothetical protein A2367_02130 [Candidatus Shapirobacteria bacterium RIFOXYB1_FULL_38_38]OGL57056.1 MAG: hypothetical protein A2410_00285 [Candidatus Shapirobacteria bacterium RIFOXYC1_FULL_38_24]OGL58512.1 MAG: hypothetical protein A2574_02535 [Candidatus Shapirobacteria 